MYLGSGGYAYAMHRVLKFLRYDKVGSQTGETTHIGSGDDIFKIEKAQEMLEICIKYNMELVANDKAKKFENQTNSFFMAANVGLHTLIFLEQMEQVPPEQLEEGKKDFDAEKRANFFKQLTTMVW